MCCCARSSTASSAARCRPIVARSTSSTASAASLYSKAGHLPELREIRLQLGQGARRRGRAVGTAGQPAGRRGRSPLLEEGRRADRISHAQHDGRAGARARDGEIIAVVQVLNAKHGRFDDADEERLRRLCGEGGHRDRIDVALRRAASKRWQEAAARALVATTASSATRRRCTRSTISCARPPRRARRSLLRGESGTGKEFSSRAPST